MEIDVIGRLGDSRPSVPRPPPECAPMGWLGRPLPRGTVDQIALTYIWAGSSWLGAFFLVCLFFVCLLSPDLFDTVTRRDTVCGIIRPYYRWTGGSPFRYLSHLRFFASWLPERERKVDSSGDSRLWRPTRATWMSQRRLSMLGPS